MKDDFVFCSLFGEENHSGQLCHPFTGWHSCFVYCTAPVNSQYYFRGRETSCNFSVIATLYCEQTTTEFILIQCLWRYISVTIYQYTNILVVKKTKIKNEIRYWTNVFAQRQVCLYRSLIYIPANVHNLQKEETAKKRNSLRRGRTKVFLSPKNTSSLATWSNFLADQVKTKNPNFQCRCSENYFVMNCEIPFLFFLLSLIFFVLFFSRSLLLLLLDRWVFIKGETKR